MASGVAKVMREKYPEVYTAYANLHEYSGLSLGHTQMVITHDMKLVFNAMTQEYYGRDGKQYVSYEAIRSCLRMIDVDYEIPYRTKIALPKIGAGLGGGDWNIIEQIINEELKDYEVLIYEL
jgi:O-acetyl-ADP-ribose deacetylase (regulator of RNase III)